MSTLAGSLLYGANIEKIPIDTIRKSNEQCKKLKGLVCVFVGGTGGIGESTVKELFIRTTQPRAYIIGRYEHPKPSTCESSSVRPSEQTFGLDCRQIGFTKHDPHLDQYEMRHANRYAGVRSEATRYAENSKSSTQMANQSSYRRTSVYYAAWTNSATISKSANAKSTAFSSQQAT